MLIVSSLVLAKPATVSMLMARGAIGIVICEPLADNCKVRTMLPAVVPVCRKILGFPRIRAVVSPGVMLTVALRAGRVVNEIAGSSVAPMALGRNCTVSVPVSMAWAAEPKGIVISTCWALVTAAPPFTAMLADTVGGVIP